jgi:hypothetical protein
MAETKKQTLNRLYKEYSLTSDDVFKHKLGFSIITRTGIEKIQAGIGLRVTYSLENLSNDQKVVLIKASGEIKEKDVYVESYGEATPDNNKNGYPVAMAEKRALSRVVLKAAGFYALGVYGEDEADDFKDRKGSAPAIEKVAAKDAPTDMTDVESHANIDLILVETKTKLDDGTANPVKVKDWMAKNKSIMTPQQQKLAAAIIKPYL